LITKINLAPTALNSGTEKLASGSGSGTAGVIYELTPM